MCVKLFTIKQLFVAASEQVPWGMSVLLNKPWRAALCCRVVQDSSRQSALAPPQAEAAVSPAQSSALRLLGASSAALTPQEVIIRFGEGLGLLLCFFCFGGVFVCLLLLLLFCFIFCCCWVFWAVGV